MDYHKWRCVRDHVTSFGKCDNISKTEQDGYNGTLIWNYFNTNMKLFLAYGVALWVTVTVTLAVWNPSNSHVLTMTCFLLNRKSHMACNFHCPVESKKLLKVTGMWRTVNVVISWKWGQTETILLQTTNRKCCMPCQMTPFPTTWLSFPSSFYEASCRPFCHLFVVKFHKQESHDNQTIGISPKF